MVISAINLITNIVGNYVFMSYLGVAGISLSTSVVYAISMSLIFLSLNSELKKQVSNE
jgi:peptidoglycan biosynthesis protein MviN/MurJ (putative lipid II flippase)